MKTWTARQVECKDCVVWRFGRSIREIENRRGRVVISESAAPGSAALFGIFALLVLVFLLTGTRSLRSAIADYAVGACTFLFFAAIGTWAAVRSVIIADSRQGQLVIERRILRWMFRVTYDAHMIEQTYVQSTRRGSILYLRFKSGKKKGILVSSDLTSLRAASIALNCVFHARH